MKPRIVLITDPAFSDDVVVHCIRHAACGVPAGSLAVQLRDKQRRPESLRLFARQLRDVTARMGAWLVVNGCPMVARDVGADGVHLGGGAGTVAGARAVLGRHGWVSVAAHDEGEVVRAARDGADAVLVSPVFASRPPSAWAPEKPPRGLAALRSARSVAAATGGRPAIFALGGVSVDRVRACSQAGAYGVAVIRALLGSPDPARAARAIYDVLAPGW